MDIPADAMVYGVGLYAVGKSIAAKIQAASLSGWLQIGLRLRVAATDSRAPDLVIGIFVALVVLRGGVHILKDASGETTVSTRSSP